jgi:nitrogen-specific signal transduction histidine kinase
MPIFAVRPADLLETIFNQVLIAVLVLDEERRIVYANEPALKVLGISRAAIGVLSARKPAQAATDSRPPGVGLAGSTIENVVPFRDPSERERTRIVPPCFSTIC